MSASQNYIARIKVIAINANNHNQVFNAIVEHKFRAEYCDAEYVAKDIAKEYKGELQSYEPDYGE